MDPTSTAEAYLRDYHRRYTGYTARCFEDAPAEADGREWPSSYAWLAERVPRSVPAVEVLDLACGDGALLSLLAARRQPGLVLTGVDFSPEELAGAERRLCGGARLVEARAQALPLPSASFDVVLCHLALMVMDDPEIVVDNIRRVLKPGGEFACLVSGGAILGDGFELFAKATRDAILSDGGARHDLGDARTATLEGLLGLVSEGFGSAAVGELVVRLRATPETILDTLSPNYETDRLSPASQGALRAKFLTNSHGLVGTNGTINCSIRLRFLTARRI
jgi:SAM-dependent methyltransferase